MVNGQLTKRVDLHRSSETLQQSVSATSWHPNDCCRVGVSSMPSPAAPTAAARSAFRRFRRNRQGSTAVEFALVAPLFFALLFAIMETGIMFFASQSLEQMTQDGARQILTGQAQGANYALSSDFRNGVVCTPPAAPPALPTPQPVLFTCANIFIDVQSGPTFAGLPNNNPIDANGVFNPAALGYNPGKSCDVVRVRFYYKWPLFVTGLGYNISNLSNGNERLLIGTAAFRNEPYSGPCP